MSKHAMPSYPDYDHDASKPGLDPDLLRGIADDLDGWADLDETDAGYFWEAFFSLSRQLHEVEGEMYAGKGTRR